jgi:hypothetical protein
LNQQPLPDNAEDLGIVYSGGIIKGLETSGNWIEGIGSALRESRLVDVMVRLRLKFEHFEHESRSIPLK